ncbi:CHAT domain-containing protein [Tolypothrix sp. VBCCA 56010]|uniref:CHAT domain-containing protein n=1 Tax=Tolypothrix sp. VBCCA 56010 TaxID=3137731 RepID=UPI003D7EB891
MKNQNKSLVVVTSRRSLLSLCLHFPVSALFSILLLSSVVVISVSISISAAQQPTATQQQETRAAAKRLLQDGFQLYKQGTAESKRQALAKYEEALKLYRVVDDKKGQAVTLLNIGLVYSNLGENQKALSYFNQSLPLWRAEDNKTGEALTLNNIGSVYSTLGEKQKALEYYNQSLPLRREVDDKAGEGRILNNIGAVYSDLGEKQLALEYYNKALPLWRAVEDKAGVAITLNNIGRVYSDLGEKQKALEYYNQSLPLSRAVENKAGVAATLTNIGLVYSDLGQKQKALEYYNQSLPLWREVDGKVGKAGVATTLSNIGLVYSDLGQKQKALEYYNQSLPLWRAVGDKAGVAITLNNIGGVYSNLGEKQKALEYYNQSLPLSREVDDKALEAKTLNNIGLVYSDLGEKQKALEYYNQALPLSREVGAKAGVAATLNNIGLVYFDLGEKQKALEYLNQSLPLMREAENKANEAATLANIAFLERSRGNLNAALTPIKDAINIIEDLRTKVVNQQLRTSYFASKQGAYQFYIDLLMQLHKQQPSKGYNAEALHISERARARNLLELLAEANVDIRQGVDPKLVAQERSLQQQLDAAEFQKTKLLQGQYTNKELENIKQLIESFDSQLDDVQAQIRVKSPEYATLTQSQEFDKLVLTLPQIQQQVLDDNTLLLEYSLGEERSFLWAVSKTGITTYELPKRADIQAAAQAFNKELLDKKDSAAIPETGIKLSQMILAPVASQLKQKRLLVVGDGALQTIPFTVLPIPGSSQNSPTPLLVQNEIVTLPSASSIGVLRNKFKARKKLPPKTIAVLADPVFSSDDKRLTNTSQSRNDEFRGSELDNQIDECLNLGSLEYTKKEAEDILSLELNSTKKFSALGFAASLNTAVKPDLSQYQIVHFATHGCVSQKNPQLSKLVLSRFDKKGGNIDGDLNLNKIYNLKLPVELVTLSACKTGLGKNVQGEGLIGLTRGFMYAGAKRVVVSLWSVNDLTTASLMQQFYQKMLQQNQNPVTAMRAAQLEMWKSGKAPYYWAAFTIQGEWQ